MKLENLSLRAKTSLNNADEVTPELLNRAIKEADELSENKPISSAEFTDIAYLRLLLLLKIEPAQIEIDLYNAALKKAQSLSALDEDGKKADIDGVYNVGMRPCEVW